MLITFVVGDWSLDGHEKSTAYTVDVKGVDSAQEVQEAYNVGEEIIGIKFMETVCRNYEDNSFPAELYERLVETDFPVNELECVTDLGEDEFLEDLDLYLNVDEYFQVYMHICKLGNPKIKYEVFSYPNINIGGYGLFY